MSYNMGFKAKWSTVYMVEPFPQEHVSCSTGTMAQSSLEEKLQWAYCGIAESFHDSIPGVTGAGLLWEENTVGWLVWAGWNQ